MSNKQQTQQVVLDQLILTSEDVSIITSILDELPHKVSRPIFNILETRLKEQGEAKFKQIQKSQKAPEMMTATDRLPE